MAGALGALCGVMVAAGCKDSTKSMADPLVGARAGEHRAFGIGYGVELDFRWAPSGSFVMGSPADEMGRGEGEEQRSVRIKDGFWIAEVETTVEVWRKVMGLEPSLRRGENHKPVTEVTWHDCRDFLERLDAPAKGWRYELPTEAQWEYACRAGETTISARQIAEMGWVDANSGERSHPVGTKPANAWMLRDMHGNVAEWCRDAVGDHHSERSIRGGSWDSDFSARAAARNSDTPLLKINRVGFRLVLVREKTVKEAGPAIDQRITSNEKP
jgi:formylglycine-generating enzyme required for sulfatase activity